MFKDSFSEKNRSYSWPRGERLSPGPDVKIRSPSPAQSVENLQRSSRALRQVPFDQNVFWDISRHFFVHGSIARAISRADVPLFSRFQVSMGMDIAEHAQGLHHDPDHDTIGMLRDHAYASQPVDTSG